MGGSLEALVRRPARRGCVFPPLRPEQPSGRHSRGEAQSEAMGRVEQIARLAHGKRKE
jgi:hypothetical protein